jgi:SAM-dependent methyltransferase
MADLPESDDRLKMFSQRYAAQDAPWDTGITPPEIVQIVAQLPPGRALDLGCGTGTNMRYLLQRGWEADGVDFVPQAVAVAQARLLGFSPGICTIFCHDVTRLGQLKGLRAPYDLVIDIGCGHGFTPAEQQKYAQDIATLTATGGTLMLYAHQPAEDQSVGWSPPDVRRTFAASFELNWQVFSDDTTSGSPTGWYRFTKTL